MTAPYCLDLSPSVQIWRGDCLAVLPLLGKVDAVVTDPPYGLAKERFRAGPPCGKGIAKKRDHWSTFSEWDRNRPSGEAFGLMLAHAEASCIWGGNYFADLLPPSMGWLFWDKGNDGLSFSNGELAWTSRHKALKTKRFMWNGCLRDGEPFQFLHPTQKPVELMIWSMEEISTPNGGKVLDPYAGSGTTLVACIRTGRKAIGIESDPTHFETMRARLQRELDAPRLPLPEPEPQAQQQELPT